MKKYLYLGSFKKSIALVPFLVLLSVTSTYANTPKLSIISGGAIPTALGIGNMFLASNQTNSGAKTFLDNTLLLRNTANTFSSKFTNKNTAARTYALPDTSGTVLVSGPNTLDANTTFDGLFNFYVGNGTPVSDLSFKTTGNATMYADNTVDIKSKVNAALSYQNGTPNINSIEVLDTGLELRVDQGDYKIFDNSTIKSGLEYANDYSAGLTARSLVDKEYVDSKFWNTSGVTTITGNTNIDFGPYQEVHNFTDGVNTITSTIGTGGEGGGYTLMTSNLDSNMGSIHAEPSSVVLFSGNSADGTSLSLAKQEAVFGWNNGTNISTVWASNSGLLATRTTDTTNNVEPVFKFKRSTSGIPAVGIGAGIQFEVRTGTSGFDERLKIGADINTVSTNISDGNEAFDLVFKTMSGGAEAEERLRLVSTGAISINGSTGTSGQVLVSSGSDSAPVWTTFVGETFDNIKTSLKDWFANTSNGIGEFFAGKVKTNELCVEDVCVTRDQFLNMVQSANAN